MAFDYPQKVLFKYCDPAGIVFFPRYFEMMNDCVEAFFDQVLDLPFEKLLQTAGVPTADIQTTFTSPSRHGDHLMLSLEIVNIGRTSLDYTISATCDDETRFQTRATLVHVDAKGRAAPWTDDIRTTLTIFKDTPE